MENDTCTKIYILSEIFNISVIQLGTGLKTIAHLAISQIVMKMDYSNNSNNLHFAFDQQESEVSNHKATSSTESPRNMSPFSNQFQYNFKMLHVGVTNSINFN
jgi:hypothetical protein